MIQSLLSIAAGFILLYSAGLFFLQRRLIYFPRDYPVIYGMSLGELDGVEIPFETGAGRQTMFYLPPRENPEAAPERLWILTGGNGSVALDWLDTVENGPRAHVGYLLIDYPGYGNCAGKPTRSTILMTVRDALPALADHLGVAPGELEGDLNVMGHSLGAAVALEFAAHYPVRQAVLISPFTSLLDMARRQVGWPLMYLLRDRFDNRARLAELATRANPPTVTVMHGGKDDVVPEFMGRELGNSHPEFTVYRNYPLLDHNWILDATRDDLWKLMGSDEDE